MAGRGVVAVAAAADGGQVGARAAAFTQRLHAAEPREDRQRPQRLNAQQHRHVAHATTRRQALPSHKRFPGLNTIQ